MVLAFMPEALRVLSSVALHTLYYVALCTGHWPAN